jgi:hypothetical protein
MYGSLLMAEGSKIYLPITVGIGEVAEPKAKLKNKS